MRLPPKATRRGNLSAEQGDAEAKGALEALGESL